MKYNYRPDIDGIRAISVLLVLFFHAGIFGIKAGFIGVDVFFVISGFLITTGINNGLKNGSFYFIQFFKKRLWRLQPVFIALLLVTTISTVLTYLLDDFLKFTDSAKWAASFQSNRYFAGLDTGYFADDTSIMPLLHTWSLSIEWQWYLALPFLMFGFYKILKVKKLDYWVFPLTIVMIGVAFYVLKDRNTPYYYYSFTARIFEMLIGSCLAAVGIKGVDKIHNTIKTIIGILCLLVIGYAAFSEKVIYQYPNWWAVKVCVAGAVLIYIGGGTKSNLITKFLSFKPLVLIGVISYSLYIWHWPVFAFIRNLAIEETWIVTIAALSTSFVLAYLSYYFIENRFRKLHFESLFKTLVILVIIPLLSLMTLNTINKKNAGFPNRFGYEYLQITKLDHQMEGLSNFRKKCWENKDTKKCTFGDLKSDKKAILIGDSFANHTIGFVDVLANDAKISIISNNFRSCLALDGIEVFHQNKLHTNCMESNKKNYQDIRDSKFNYVIIAEAWNRYFSNDLPDRALALEKSIQAITESGATPIIITSTYDTISDVDYSKQYYQSVKLHTENKKTIYFNKLFEKNDAYVKNLFSSLQKKYPSLILLDMRSMQCNNNKCLYIAEDNYPVYRDNEGHITDYASYQFGKRYLEKYGNPLK